MKTFKRILSVLLAVLLTAAAFPPAAFAAEANTPKEEVVYINLNADGSVKEITVVNIFDLDADGQIVDYGAYESLRNMTTTDTIGYSGDTVTISAAKGKLYYEGKLSSSVMPWNISIHYYLDGKEYSAEEIAGKSGSLKITMEVTENKDCGGSFFDGYALQASFTLDTKKCSNIRANDATAANVGSDKQLTYTILPGEGADIEITADVTDFEMAPIAINGVKLQLAIEVDDTEIQNRIDDLIDGVEELDSGAEELRDGAEELYDGTVTLSDKTGELYSGVGELNSGAAELSDGLATVTAQNEALLSGAWEAFKGLCTATETLLNAEFTKNGMDAVSLTPDTYEAVFAELLRGMDAESVYQMAYQKALAEVTAKVTAEVNASAAAALPEEQKAQIINENVQKLMQTEEVTAQIAAAVSAAETSAAGIVELKAKLDDYRLFYEGLQSYTAAVSSAAGGAETLNRGMRTLYTNVGLLNDAVAELGSGAKSLLDGANTMKSGTNEFVQETADMNGEVSSEIDAMLSTVSGGETEVESFVSEKNTNVDAVQFVIQTEAITIEAPVSNELVVEESLTFWQKLLRLFGLY